MTPVIVDGVLYGADADVQQFMHRVLGCGFFAGPFVTHAVLGEDGRIVMGTLWANHKPGQDIEMWVAATTPRVARPAIMRRILAYPFIQLALPRITAEIHQDNTRAIRLAEGMGMVREGFKRGSNRILYGLLRDECPLFTRERHGRQSAITPAAA